MQKDDDAGHGLDCGCHARRRGERRDHGRTIIGSAKDVAGNTGTDSVTVKLDRTAPTITASITGGTLGANGWYTGPVTVYFMYDDPTAANGAAASGIVPTACPKDYTFAANGPTSRSPVRSATGPATAPRPRSATSPST